MDLATLGVVSPYTCSGSRRLVARMGRQTAPSRFAACRHIPSVMRWVASEVRVVRAHASGLAWRQDRGCVGGLAVSDHQQQTTMLHACKTDVALTTMHALELRALLSRSLSTRRRIKSRTMPMGIQGAQ